MTQEQEKARALDTQAEALVAQNKPLEALGLYKEALALDDQDFRRLIKTGHLELNAAGDVKAARGYFEQALELAQGLGDQRLTAAAHSNLANALVRQGRLEEALQSYQSASEIREALVDQELRNALAQRNLSLSYNNIGDMEQSQGWFAMLVQILEQSFSIYQALADQDPSNAQAWSDLSISYERIGDIEQRQGRLEAALERYQEALAIAQRLADLDAHNAQWQEDFTRIKAKIEALEVQMRAQISEKLNQIAEKTPNAETIVFNEAAKNFEAQPLVKSDTQVVQGALHRLSITLRLVEGGGHNIKGIFKQELTLLEDEYLNKVQTLVVTQFAQTVADVRFLASDKIKENDLQTDPTCNALLRGLDTIVLDMSTHSAVREMLESRRKISPDLPEGWDEAALKTASLLTAAASNPPLQEELEQDAQTAQDDAQSSQRRQSARYRIVSRVARIANKVWGIAKQVIENVEALAKLHRFITQSEFWAFLDMIIKWVMGGR